jgi:hypothetical protein
VRHDTIVSEGRHLFENGITRKYKALRDAYPSSLRTSVRPQVD